MCACFRVSQTHTHSYSERLFWADLAGIMYHIIVRSEVNLFGQACSVKILKHPVTA